MNYRSLAKERVAEVSRQLALEDSTALKYAALELRMAMEAITYDRAQAFKDEFPESEYDTWQPKKVMSVLLEIEPTTDRDSSLAYGIEDEPGVPTTKMKALGNV
jgi:hypothetical protein